MDDTDRALLAHLAADARVSVTTLARRLRMARSTVQARIERLESTGAIAGYTVKLGDAVQRGRIRATVLITVEPRSQTATVARLKAIAEVERIHSVGGRFDLLAQVAADSTADLDAVLDAIGAIPGVRGSESLIHLSTKLDRAL